MKSLWRKLAMKWHNYRYRFVPWIILNMENRTVRSVQDTRHDKMVSDDFVEQTYLRLFTALEKHQKQVWWSDKEQDVMMVKNVETGFESDHCCTEGKRHLATGIHTGTLKSCENKTVHNNFCPESFAACRKWKHSETLLTRKQENTRDCQNMSVSAQCDRRATSRGRNHLCETMVKKPLSHGTLSKDSLHKTELDERVEAIVSEIVPLPDEPMSPHKPDVTLAHCDDPHRGRPSQYVDIGNNKILSNQNADCHKEPGFGRHSAGDPSCIMYDVLGFSIKRRPSQIRDGGLGVYVTKGVVPKGTVVAVYPGTIYMHSEPMLLQSLGNPFIFRCLDGIHIDGHDKYLSRMIFRSCAQRDRLGPHVFCDISWLTPCLLNPMAVGQYVNNQYKGAPANVCYQEFDVPVNFPVNLRKFIPNNFYGTLQDTGNIGRVLRTVALVSLRDIKCGEELLSSYFTLVY
ncbi:uncharacterized protein [Diadema setosum]|uniref:uncharacterized protein isoform X1 n=3 Tax=Diadema setosum TaxID=31175 RepID=UPI003B3B1DCD